MQGRDSSGDELSTIMDAVSRSSQVDADRDAQVRSWRRPALPRRLPAEDDEDATEGAAASPVEVSSDDGWGHIPPELAPLLVQAGAEDEHELPVESGLAQQLQEQEFCPASQDRIAQVVADSHWRLEPRRFVMPWEMGAMNQLLFGIRAPPPWQAQLVPAPVPLREEAAQQQPEVLAQSSAAFSRVVSRVRRAQVLTEKAAED